MELRMDSLTATSLDHSWGPQWDRLLVPLSGPLLDQLSALQMDSPMETSTAKLKEPLSVTQSDPKLGQLSDLKLDLLWDLQSGPLLDLKLGPLLDSLSNLPWDRELDLTSGQPSDLQSDSLRKRERKK